MTNDTVLFIGDRSRWSHLAAICLDNVFADVQTIFWDYGEPKPTLQERWAGDRIFTF